ncbi:PH domain-containing protein [Pseudonocardia sp.]|uniref:PH domain-containing protein n=1 Tax=Pseudonocardia sp. TaxID=60912 RepID=UPI003D12FBE3
MTRPDADPVTPHTDPVTPAQSIEAPTPPAGFPAASRAAPADDLAVETPWRRLDPRMLVVGPLGNLAGLLPFVLILLITGQGDLSRLWYAAGAAVVVVLFGVLRWRTTRYRITDERVELHTGLFNRQRRSVPRDRIRTVDTTAKLLHRLFGLSVVQVSAAAGAGQDDAGLSLDAVGKPEAERLRLALLTRSRAVSAVPTPAGPQEIAAQQAEELARLNWAWIRFAPLTVSSLVAVGAFVGALFNIVGDVGLSPGDLVDTAGDRFAMSLLLAVLVLVAALVGIAVAGAMLLFAERWFGYRLTREPDGTLRVRRGLLTRRSLSVAEERLRGVELSEPALLRLGRGGQAKAVSTGLSGGGEGGVLGPPAPIAEGHRLAAAVLRDGPVTRTPLRRHPRAALVRRLNRAVGGAVVLVALLWLLDVALFGTGLGPVALLLLPLAALVGYDRWRNLGHALTERYLVARHGSLLRRTVVLQRGGVIGWTLRQSVFQRRSGLVTLTAVTAAGDGGYPVVDIAAADGAALADAAVPGLLAPFLAGAPHPGR